MRLTGSKVIRRLHADRLTAAYDLTLRPLMDIIGLTTNRKVWFKLALSWGVIPVMRGTFTSRTCCFITRDETAKNYSNESRGALSYNAGQVSGVSGNTS